MKKIFMMALAAFVVMSCAKDPNGDGNDGSGQAGKTHAYFSFKLDGGAKLPSTRALPEYNPEEGAADAAEANDALFAPGDLYMLIFNANTKALEQKIDVLTPVVSMVLTAGPKKIFVFSNTAKLEDNVLPVGTATFNDRFGALAVNSTILDNVYAKTFSYSAGVSQANGMTDLEKAAPRTFLLKNLSTRVLDGTNGIPMGSTAEGTYDVVADITAAQAAVGPANKFVINIHYMVAKARMQMAAGVIGTQTDGKTVISNPFFAVKNLATNTNYVQKWGTGGVESYYHNDFDGSTLEATYPLHFDRAATANIAVSTTPATSEYVYVPENTSVMLYRGQSSYYAVKLTYRPGFVATTVDHHPNTVIKLDGDYKVLGTGAGETGSDDYVYVHTNIALAKATIPANTFITNLATFKQALWIAENNLAWPGPSADAAADALLAGAKVKDNYDGFKDATSWYRLDMGEGVGTATKYGVLRGNKYTATINKITGPGKPGETDLDNGGTNPVVSNTYINASIVAAAWKAVSQGGDL